MIEARLPDGTSLSFPDGTADEVIDKAVSSHLAEKPSMVGSGLRGAVKGATFGFGDELRAGTDALVQGVGNLVRGSEGRPSMGETYDRSLATSREQDRLDAETNPVSNVAGQVYGGVGGAVLASRLLGPLIPALPLVMQANKLLSSVPGWLRTPAGIAAGGATAGAVQGAGEGEGGIGPRAQNALVGGAVGGAVAPALRAVTAAVPAVFGRATHAFGWRDAETAADRHLLRALGRSDTTLDSVESRLAGAGSDPTALVDVGGANVRNLGATAANTPGAAMESADQFVQTRRSGRPDRLFNAGDEAFGGGSSDNIAQELADQNAQRSADAGPLYKAAFGKPAGMTEPMQHIIKHPIGQSGLKRGLEIQDIENTTRRARGEPEVPTHDPAIHYDENGDPRIVGVPNMRSLDAIKRGMDAMIDDARDDKTLRVKWTERLRAVEGMRKTWVELLDQNNPDYAAARAAWGGPSAQIEAVEGGRKALRTEPSIVRQRMASPAEGVPEAYRLGAGRDYHTRVADPRTAGGSARTLLENKEMQERLAHLLDDEGLTALNNALHRERGYAQVEQTVSPRANSQTARLTAGGDDLAHDPAGPVMTGVRQALAGHPIQGAMTVGNDWLVRRLGQGINPATSDALASRLFVTSPDGRQRVTAALRNRLLEDALRAEQVRQLTGPVVRSLSQTAGGRAVD